MFTGIVTGVGRLQKIEESPSGLRIRIHPPFSSRPIKIGESIAVNGCCLTVVRKLTVVKKGTKSLEFDVARESLRVTTLGKLRPGTFVNLERALRLGDRLGGGIVSGHVDGIGEITADRQYPEGREWSVSCPKPLVRYLVPKGSITIDGVNLTLNRVRKSGAFTVCLIPETLRKTTLGTLRKGDRVNLEVDTVSKYIENLARSCTPSRHSIRK